MNKDFGEEKALGDVISVALMNLIESGERNIICIARAGGKSIMVSEILKGDFDVVGGAAIDEIRMLTDNHGANMQSHMMDLQRQMAETYCIPEEFFHNKGKKSKEFKRLQRARR